MPGESNEAPPSWHYKANKLLAWWTSLHVENHIDHRLLIFVRSPRGMNFLRNFFRVKGVDFYCVQRGESREVIQETLEPFDWLSHRMAIVDIRADFGT